jgi:hypothetical protein
VGRLAVLIDPALNLVKGSQTGYFSLFECLNDEDVAGCLFEASAGWLRQHGMGVLKGPVSPAGPHEDESKGLLVEGFGRPPVFMTSYNPPYYQRLMEGHGFNKDFDVYAYLLNKDQVFARDPGKIVEYAARRYGFRLETVDLTNKEREVRDIKRVLDLAVPAEWADMIPPSLEEVRAVTERLRQVADPDFVVLARAGDEPVGFAAGLPDYNQVLLHLNGRLSPLGLLKYFYYRRKITWLRVFVICPMLCTITFANGPWPKATPTPRGPPSASPTSGCAGTSNVSGGNATRRIESIRKLSGPDWGRQPTDRDKQVAIS